MLGNGDTLLEELVVTFITSIKVTGTRSVSTVQNYEHYLQKFLKFIGDDTLVSKITIEKIESFHAHLLDTGITQKTASYYLIALRSLFHWMARRNIPPPVLPDSIELPKTQRTLENVPTIEEVQTLLKSADPERKTQLKARCILELLISSGLRVSELTNLKRGDLDFTTHSITIIGKGNKQRIVFFSRYAGKLIQQYLLRREDEIPYLFIQRVNGFNSLPITPRSIQRLIKKYCKKAGLSDLYHTHSFRHFYACYLLEKGADLFSIKELLGHSSIATTQIYLHKTNKQLEKAHALAFGFTEPLTRRHRKYNQI